MKKSFQTIWIIGASSGIGESLTRKFHDHPTYPNQKIIISARNTDKLAKLASEMPGLSPVPVDITDPNAVNAAVNTVESEFGLPDLVILAAGIYSPMKLDAFSPLRSEAMSIPIIWVSSIVWSRFWPGCAHANQARLP